MRDQVAPAKVVIYLLLMAVFLCLIPPIASPQYAAPQDSPRNQNLETCLSGRYPALCDHSILSREELARVLQAETQENLRMCLDGRYPALCRHDLLTSSEAERVSDAEKRENLRTCLDGRYPALCRHNVLTPAEEIRVSDAERRENLKTCLDGRYVALCKHCLLWSDEARRVHEAEQQASQNQPDPSSIDTQNRHKSKVDGLTGCEDGHWIDSVLDDGEIIKLEDGSLWEVDGADAIDSALWLPVSDVLVCHGKIINLDDKESVGVTRIR